MNISTTDTLSEIQWLASQPSSRDTTVFAVVIPSVQDVVTVAGGNGKGTTLKQFDNPDGIFIDGNSNLFVVDQNNHRILKFPPGSSGSTNGIVVAGGNGEGSNANQLDFPMSIYVDAAGYLYVADFINGRIQKFPPNSTSGTSGVTVAKSGLDGPSCVAIDALGNIIVGDEAGQDIVKYPANSTATTAGDTLATGLGYVFQIFISGNNDIYASLSDFYVVVRFTAASNYKSSNVVVGGTGYGNGANQLSAPTSCYVDASGYIYVLDGVTCRVLRFPPGSTSGSSGVTVAGGNGNRFGSGPNQLDDPTCVFLDKNGNIYVADDGNNRVQEYFKDGPTTTFIDSTYEVDPPGPTQPITFYAVVTNNKGCTDTTNSITIIPTKQPGINISSNAINPNLCGQFTEDLIFTASPSNGGPNPGYQWLLNGNPVGTNSPTYTGTFSNKDIVSCTLTSNVQCATNPTVTSPDFVVQFHLPPSATLQKSGSSCTGIDTLSVNPDIYGIFKINWNYGTTIDTTYFSKMILDTGKASIGITVAGGNGTGKSTNQFDGPNSVCLDAAGNIYVADGYNNRVLEFAPGSSSFTNGLVVAGGNGNGNASNQLSFPTAVFVDAYGNLFVADGNNDRVQKFPSGSSSSTNGVTVAGGNGAGTGANQLSQPISIAVDGSGNLLVCDELNNRIQSFPANSTQQTNGTTVAGGNGQGSALNQLNNPNAITLDKSSNVYIADLDNYRVLKFGPGSNSSTFGTVVLSSQNMVQPFGVFVDNSNNLFVTDAKSSKVLMFAPNSQQAVIVAGALGVGPANNQLDEPYSISGDANSNLFIADYNNNRVQKYTHFISIIDTTFVTGLPGGYTATLTDTSGCSFTTNAITLTAPQKPSISITAADTTVCSGTPMLFTATASNTDGSPEYQWLLNSSDVGTNSKQYSAKYLVNGDMVACVVSNGNGCGGADTSNIISPFVKPAPTIGPAKDISIALGESTILNIPAQNNVISYLWSPPYNLSAENVQNPIASPLRTTTYFLTVTAPNNCTSTDSIRVSVTSKIYIPNAFTPNGDGKNDIFYVLGGLPGDAIKDFTVFNRFGQKIFQVQNAVPNYTSFGWDGKFNGEPLPSDTYVYVVTIKASNGTETIYKGYVVLLR